MSNNGVETTFDRSCLEIELVVCRQPAGGKRAAAIMRQQHTARINGHEPYAYLKDVFERLPTQPATRAVIGHWKKAATEGL